MRCRAGHSGPGRVIIHLRNDTEEANVSHDFHHRRCIAFLNYDLTMLDHGSST
jgi:hypothetical protein